MRPVATYVLSGFREFSFPDARRGSELQGFPPVQQRWGHNASNAPTIAPQGAISVPPHAGEDRQLQLARGTLDFNNCHTVSPHAGEDRQLQLL
jgi:hypothetical protein